MWVINLSLSPVAAICCDQALGRFAEGVLNHFKEPVPREDSFNIRALQNVLV
jgi:hypothetical protein